MAQIEIITYAEAPVDVRADIVDLHRRIWRWLAEPGLWWTGAERVAIATELRQAQTCALCAARKAALSPYAVGGEHDGETALPAPVIEAVHRIATDPGRLTEAWYRETLADTVSDAAYVELIVVIACVVAVDTFAHGVGAPTFALPTPVAGAPSRIRPEGALAEGAWVPTIPLGGAGEAEADIYNDGYVSNIYRSISLAAPQSRMFFDILATHYVDRAHITDPAYSARAINRAQMEMVAARVSSLNQCFY